MCIRFLTTALLGLLAPALAAQDCTLAADVNIGGHSFPEQLYRVGNSYLLFMADDGVHGEEPWRWTPEEGGVLLADIKPGPESSGAYGFHSTWLRGELVTLFSADDDVTGPELWITDGTPEGTWSMDLNPGPDGSQARYFRDVPGQDRVLFRAYRSDSGLELWTTDGTVAGTQLVVDLNPGAAVGVLLLGNFVGDWLLFSGLEASSGFGLYRTDGTAAGTVLIKSDFSSVHHSLGLGDLAVVVGNDGVHGQEPYLSDGTAEGTTLLADIRPGDEGSGARNFALRDGLVLFSADDGVHGEELWRSDLTEAGTWLLADLWEDGGSMPRDLVLAGDGFVYFTAGEQGSSTRRLWRTDGTAAGTVPVPDLSGADPVNPKDLMAARDGVYFCSSRLYFAGGPEVGIIDACGDDPDNPSTSAEGPVVFDGAVFYPAYQAAAGRELYRLDEAGAHTLDLALGDAGIRLDGDAPLLGGSLDLKLVGAPVDRIGFVVASASMKLPHKLFAKEGAALWLQPESSMPLFLVNAATWSGAVPIPADAALIGASFNLQAWFLPDGNYPAAVSNGLLVRLGE